MRALVALAAAMALAAGRADAGFVDAVLGEVEGRTITASDVAVARALGLFGLAPSAAPIEAGDVERMIRAWLVVDEAQRLRLRAEAEGSDEAWSAVARRLGGPEALDAWLSRAAVEPAFARRLVEWDLDWRRFVDLRFRAFVFITDDQVVAALGGAPDTPEARARAREALADAEAEQRLDEWAKEAAGRATIRRLLAPGDREPCPVPMPAAP